MSNLFNHKDHPINSAFALKMGFSVIKFDDENGHEWEMWKNPSGQRIELPDFVNSVDAVMPFIPADSSVVTLRGPSGSWQVSVGHHKNLGVADNLARAMVNSLLS